MEVWAKTAAYACCFAAQRALPMPGRAWLDLPDQSKSSASRQPESQRLGPNGCGTRFWRAAPDSIDSHQNRPQQTRGTHVTGQESKSEGVLRLSQVSRRIVLATHPSLAGAELIFVDSGTRWSRKNLTAQAPRRRNPKKKTWCSHISLSSGTN